MCAGLTDHGGQGGKPRALVAGEGWEGRRGWMAVPKKGGGVGAGWQFQGRGGPNTEEEAPRPTPRP